MVGEFPPRQLIGPLLGLNALLVAPFLLVTHWHFSRTVLLLHLASAATLVVSSGMHLRAVRARQRLGGRDRPGDGADPGRRLHGAAALDAGHLDAGASPPRSSRSRVLAALGDLVRRALAAKAIGLVAVAAMPERPARRAHEDAHRTAASASPRSTACGPRSAPRSGSRIAPPRDMPLRSMPKLLHALELPDRLLRAPHPRRPARDRRPPCRRSPRRRR